MIIYFGSTILARLPQYLQKHVINREKCFHMRSKYKFCAITDVLCLLIHVDHPEIVRCQWNIEEWSVIVGRVCSSKCELAAILCLWISEC